MKAKSNDRGVPKDEMQLARMLAAANARGMKWCSGSPFKRSQLGFGGPYLAYADPDDATHCCAVGAMHLAGDVTLRQTEGNRLRNVWHSNDRYPTVWTHDEASIGYAYRCAMKEDE